MTSSPSRSSIRPMRCCMRWSSNRTSTFMSSTVAMRSRCASVGGVSRSPVSYVSDVVALELAISICRSRSSAKLRSLTPVTAVAAPVVPLALPPAAVAPAVVAVAVDVVVVAAPPSITTRLSRLGGEESTSPPSSMVSWRASVAWLACSLGALGNTCGVTYLMDA